MTTRALAILFQIHTEAGEVTWCNELDWLRDKDYITSHDYRDNCYALTQKAEDMVDLIRIRINQGTL